MQSNQNVTTIELQGKPVRAIYEGDEIKINLEDVMISIGMDADKYKRDIEQLKSDEQLGVIFESDQSDEPIYTHSDSSHSVRYYLDPMDRYYSVEDIARIAGIEDIEKAMDYAFLNHDPSIFVLKSVYEDEHPVGVLEMVNIEGALTMAMFDIADNPYDAGSRLANLAQFLKPLGKGVLR